MSVEHDRAAEQCGEALDRIKKAVAEVIVGQEVMIDRLILALVADGHILLEGVPGLAKTTAVQAIANAVDTGFSRIQFTPDLLPADLLGTQIYVPQEGRFTTKKGPIFSNLILADEINRAPAKVQSALLEAMQERQVTLGPDTFPLPKPFLVLATQNPIDQEGTYPLPEAQVDRFMMKIKIGYPTRDEERSILGRIQYGQPKVTVPVIHPDEITSAQELAKLIYVDPRVEGYIVDLVMATRDPQAAGLAKLKPLIQFGASPRATISLARATRVHALMQGRAFVTPQDVKDLAPDIIRHRIIISYDAEAQGINSDDIIRDILAHIDVP